jgi:hypothetical protein
MRAISACVAVVNLEILRGAPDWTISLKQSKKNSIFGKDKRRKHRHWQVTVFYRDGERFARVYTDRAKATSFAERQKKSPVVKTTRVVQVG